MSDMGVAPVAESTPQGLSQWQRVTNTFTAPSKTFEDIKRGNRSWWLPFVIFAVIGYVLFAAVYFKIGRQQVVDNQIQLNPKQAESMAQAPPDQREMSDEDLAVHHRGRIHRQSGLVLAGVAACRSVSGARSTLSLAARPSMAAFLPLDVCEFAGNRQNTVGDRGDLRGSRARVVQHQEFCPHECGSFLNPLEANKALYALATAFDVLPFGRWSCWGWGSATVAGVKRTLRLHRGLRMVGDLRADRRQELAAAMG